MLFRIAWKSLLHSWFPLMQVRFLKNRSRCLGPFAKFQHSIQIFKWTTRVSKLSLFFLSQIIISRIKLINTLLICCKFLCCIKSIIIIKYTIFNRLRASYVILLIYMLNRNSLVYASPLNDISKLSFWKTERLPRMHIPLDCINENANFRRIHVIVTL